MHTILCINTILVLAPGGSRGCTRDHQVTPPARRATHTAGADLIGADANHIRDMITAFATDGVDQVTEGVESLMKEFGYVEDRIRNTSLGLGLEPGAGPR